MSKRRRTDEPTAEENPAEPPPPTRSEEFWLYDGNIVLQAGNVQFKVHKGFLARHSTIFETILSMPHTDDEPTVEECPVLKVHDEPEDIKNMLTAIYDKDHDTLSPLPFRVVASLVRLGKKYEMDSILRMGIARLKKEFPVHLFPWNFDRKLQAGASRIEGINTPAALVALIELALECDVLWVLPSAYYRCCMDMEATLFGGEAHQRLLEYQGKLAEAMSAELIENSKCTSKFAEGRDDSVPDPGRCASGLWALKPNVRLTDMTPHRRSDLLKEELCNPCIERIVRMSQKAMEEQWKNLPLFFDLPTWEELKREYDHFN
ncbi:hypothetical protein D9611_009368 [Ephemerocybe angulata]|uniref:BTB domain-containing protein n=1 Tax=Ephemerocybe angulata TaxID=980116 RepID=A0A8H5BIV7_9AGAR|nr:hypothetical protein D9611_009368 [Tulosesus angulatus]